MQSKPSVHSKHKVEESLTEINDDRLDIDTIEALLSIVPTADEVSKVKAFAQDLPPDEICELSGATRLCLVAGSIPRLEPRLKSLRLRCSFPEFVEDTYADMEILQEAVAQVRPRPEMPRTHQSPPPPPFARVSGCIGGATFRCL